ncbi:MAG: glycosyltransferase family 4 protein [Anaerolineales bacterium]
MLSLNNKKPKILHITAGFAIAGPLGGIERFGIQLVEAFDQQLLEPILCGLWDFQTDQEEPWLSYLREKNISAFTATIWKEKQPYRSFWDAITNIPQKITMPIDIIHSHSEFGDVGAIILRKKLRAKYILRTVHNEREWKRRPLRRNILTNLLYPFVFSHEFAVSNIIGKQLNQRFSARLLQKKSPVIYNAINFDRFKLTTEFSKKYISSIWNIPQYAKLIISIGRLTEQKGYRFLLDAMFEIQKTRKDIHLVLIGEGELKRNLQAYSEKLKISQFVHFAGKRNDIENLLPHFDVFVSSSLWEGLPTVLLESIAARVPIIGTQVSGTTEIICHEKNGLLVPPKDSIALSQAIITLLNNPEKAKIMAEQAYHDAIQKFSISSIANQYQKFYGNLLNT